MRHRVLGLEAVLPDGTVMSDLTRVTKVNEGLDIKHLLTESPVGDGTLVLGSHTFRLASMAMGLGQATGFDVDGPSQPPDLCCYHLDHQVVAVSGSRGFQAVTGQVVPWVVV